MLDRVMARKFYGRWYVPPPNFNYLERQAYIDKNLTTNESMSTKNAKNKKLQIDWNRQVNMTLTKNIPTREITLSKMLAQMSNEELQTGNRSQAIGNYTAKLRKKSEYLLTDTYLKQITRMDKGTAEAYFYELRKVVEHENDDYST